MAEGPCCNNGSTASQAAGRSSKASDAQHRVPRPGDEPNGHIPDDAQGPLAARQQLGEIEIRCLPASPDSRRRSIPPALQAPTAADS